MVFYLVAFFIFGCAVGSFLNVVVYRTIQSEGIIFGRSYCDFCRRRLSTLDLVPILSFVGLRGRCRYCRRKLSWQYPIVETLTGLLFLATFYYQVVGKDFSIVNLVFYLFVVCTLIVVAVVDLKYSLIPTTFVFFASLVTLFYNYFHLNSQSFVEGIFGAFLLAFAFLGLVVITRGRGMGTGDIPLVFWVGLFLGWPQSVIAIFLSFVSGAIFSLFLLASRRKTFGQTIPFGPFLVASTIAVFFWGNSLVSWYFGFF